MTEEKKIEPHLKISIGPDDHLQDASLSGIPLKMVEFNASIKVTLNEQLMEWDVSISAYLENICVYHSFEDSSPSIGFENKGLLAISEFSIYDGIATFKFVATRLEITYV